MSESHYLKCGRCKSLIQLEGINVEAQIVSKDVPEANGVKKFVAVRYYFICPSCRIQYTCFYKDKIVNVMFNDGREEEAKERMEMLWEIFEDVN